MSAHERLGRHVADIAALLAELDVMHERIAALEQETRDLRNAAAITHDESNEIDADLTTKLVRAAVTAGFGAPDFTGRHGCAGCRLHIAIRHVVDRLTERGW